MDRLQAPDLARSRSCRRWSPELLMSSPPRKPQAHSPTAACRRMQYARCISGNRRAFFPTRLVIRPANPARQPRTANRRRCPDMGLGAHRSPHGDACPNWNWTGWIDVTGCSCPTRLAIAGRLMFSVNCRAGSHQARRAAILPPAAPMRRPLSGKWTDVGSGHDRPAPGLSAQTGRPEKTRPD